MRVAVKVGSNSMVVLSSLVVMSQTKSLLPSAESAHRYGLKRMVWATVKDDEVGEDVEVSAGSMEERAATSLPRTWRWTALPDAAKTESPWMRREVMGEGRLGPREA